jgi:hypothetical protein
MIASGPCIGTVWSALFSSSENCFIHLVF